MTRPIRLAVRRSPDRPAARGAEGNEAAASSGPDSGAERALLDRARREEPEAYEELIRMHQDRIYGLVLRMVREASLAEELTQDTFIKAFRSLGSFRGEARFTTWLYRIAINLCHDQRQSVAARIRSQEMSLETADGRDPGTGSNRPDDAMAEGEMARHFQHSLEALDAPLREAFLLRHQEGLGYEEIASALEITRTNAKVRVHRARERILETLRSLGHEV